MSDPTHDGLCHGGGHSWANKKTHLVIQGGAAGFNSALHPGAAQPRDEKLDELLIAGYEHQQTQG